MDGLIVKKNSSLEYMTGFTLQERRFFAFCIQYFDSRPGAENPEEIKISVEAFKKAYPEYKKYRPGQIFDILHTARHSINDHPYRWQEDDGRQREEDWFTGHGTDINEITISLNRHEKIRDLFLNIRDNFIKYHMRDVGRLSTPSAWSFYEYIKEKYLNGKCMSWTVTAEDIRARLGATDKYQRFGDFYQYLVARPIKEINKNTDLTVECKKRKQGVSIHSLIFYVKTKATDPDVIDIEDLAETFLQEQLRYGISKAAAEKNVKRAEKDGRLGEAIETIEKVKKSYRKHGKGPFAGYLAKPLTSLLFERSLFQEDNLKARSDYSKTINDLKSSSDSYLKQLMEAGNKQAEKILADRLKQGNRD